MSVTRNYLKTFIQDTTVATLVGDGALQVTGGANVYSNLIVGGNNADGVIFTRSNTNTITRAGAIELSATSNSALSLVGTASSSFVTNTGSITVGAPTSIILDTPSVSFDGNSTYNTVTNTLSAVTGGLNFVTTGANNIILDPGVGGFIQAGLNHVVTNQKDLVTKEYVDTLAAGLDVHASCRLIAFSLPAYTAAGTKVGKTLTGNVNGLLSVDGVPVVTGNRVVVNIGASPGIADNGIYVVTAPGSAGTQYVLTRATDADTNPEMTTGSFTFIEEGTLYAGTGFIVTTLNVDIDVTPITFTQFSSAGVLNVTQLAGSGLAVLVSSGNDRDFYRIDALTNNASARTDALTIALSGVTNEIVLDMSKFVGPVTFANSFGGISVTPANNVTTLGTGTNNVFVDNSTKTIGTNTGNLLFAPATNVSIFDGASDVTINASSAATSSITGSAELALVSTGGANGILINPGNSITTVGGATPFILNNGTGSISRNGLINVNTSSGNIALNAASGVTTIGNLNTISINTSSVSSISGSNTLTLETSVGNVIIDPATDITHFGTGTPVIIESTGTIRRNDTLTIRTDTNSIVIRPENNVVTIGNSTTVAVTTGISPIVSGSTTLTLASATGNVIVDADSGITAFGTVTNPVLINEAGTITRATGITLGTTGTGDVLITPASNITAFNSTLTVNAGTNPTINAVSGNLVLSTTAGNASIITNGSNFTSVISGAATIATSPVTGTLRVSSSAGAGQAGLGVDGTIFAATSINAPIFSNGSTSGNSVTIRGNTTDATGAVIIPTRRMQLGNGSAVNKYTAIYNTATNFPGGAGTVTLFTLVMPANLNAYANIEIVVDDGPTNVHIYSAKVLFRVLGTIASKVDLIEPVTDPTKFTYDFGTSNTIILRYNQTSATANANINLMYMTCGTSTSDITSLTF
jgi:hypothetical protein